MSGAEVAEPLAGGPRDAAPTSGRRVGGRLSSALVTLWAGITGVAPHVLHHVGPLAGAAFLSGLAGTALFGALGFVVTVPMLLRLRRRFGTWLAPGIALGLFITVFTVSTVVIGPRVASAGDTEVPITDAEHEEHHG